MSTFIMMEHNKKILQALTNNDNVLVSDIDNSFTIIDLKNMIVSAMLKTRVYFNGDNDVTSLKDWQIYDTENWCFEEWIKQNSK